MSLIQDIITGATQVSEWHIYFDHAVATCNEAAEAVITGVYGIMPATQATDIWLTKDQIARGEADARGASNWANDAAQLARLGIANTTYDPAWVGSHDWAARVRSALAQGIPVLFGVPKAFNLRDSVTGAQPDTGVQGHALTFIGEDSSGFIVADPNTAPGTLMHYTAANLNAAGINSLVVPNAPPQAVQSGGGGGGGGGLIDFTQPEQWVGGVLADAGMRIALFLIALVLLIVGLLIFFTGGSGRGATGELAKGGAKAAGAAVFGG